MNMTKLDSVAAMLALIDRPCNVEGNQQSLDGWKADAEDHAWHGIQNDKVGNEGAYQTADRLVRSGWDRGVALMEDVTGVEVPRPNDIKRRMVWTDQGDEIEMQRVYAGDLDTCWRRTKRLPVSGPYRVRIVVDNIANAFVNAETMRWRGVAAMKMADCLVAAGYQVEIESAFKANSSSLGVCGLRVVVKPYDMPLNLSSLAATTALPAFFRAHGHAMHIVMADMIGRRQSYVGYGVLSLALDDIIDGSNEHVLLAGQGICNAKDASQWMADALVTIENHMRQAA